MNHYLYADDTQIYMSLSVSNAKESLEKLQQCVMAKGLSLILVRQNIFSLVPNFGERNS